MTQQYKVIKDLPRAKAGTILALVDDFLDNGRALVKEEGLRTSLIVPRQLIDETISEGFVELVKGRQRVGRQDEYYYIDDENDLVTATEYDHNVDKSRFDLGNYFQSRGAALLVIKAQKLMFEWLRTPAAVDTHIQSNAMMQAISKARLAVLEEEYK